MNLDDAIKGRRSIRKYEEKAIEKEKLEKIVALASYAPSWKNTQVTSYIAVQDETVKARLANECTHGFEYNTKTMSRAAAVVVVVTRHNVSGYEKDGSYSTDKEDRWETFDAGIATQTFCLAAYEEGIGTCVLGIFDEDKVKDVLGLGEDVGVAALIAAGYPEKEPAMPPRKGTDELLKIV